MTKLLQKAYKLPFPLLYTSLTSISANSWLSTHPGIISGAKMVKNINITLRSVALRGPSPGGMFGCRVAQAHIIFVETHPQMISNNVRVEQPSTQFDDPSSSRTMMLAESAARTATWPMRRSNNGTQMSRNIVDCGGVALHTLMLLNMGCSFCTSLRAKVPFRQI